MIGYQLMDGLGSRAAFNVFSDTAGALTKESVDVGAVLAAFTSVSLAASERQTTAENLRKGLESNREIGKAIGLLMAAHQVSDDRGLRDPPECLEPHEHQARCPGREDQREPPRHLVLSDVGRQGGRQCRRDGLR